MDFTQLIKFYSNIDVTAARQIYLYSKNYKILQIKFIKILYRYTNQNNNINELFDIYRII
jgi:hypothetical protein